jgi:hypothetical protein
VCHAESARSKQKETLLTALSSNRVVTLMRYASPASRATRVVVYCKAGTSTVLKDIQNSSVNWTNCPVTLENVSYTKVGKKTYLPGLPLSCEPKSPVQQLSPRFDRDRTHPGVCACRNDTRHTLPDITDDGGGGLREDPRKKSRHGEAAMGVIVL